MRHYLVDFKLEFGLDSEAQLRLADEISDTCRLWNQSDTDPNRRVMDKDRFRRDLGMWKTPISKFWVLARTAISGKTQADAKNNRFTWCGRAK